MEETRRRKDSLTLPGGKFPGGPAQFLNPAYQSKVLDAQLVSEQSARCSPAEPEILVSHRF